MARSVAAVENRLPEAVTVQVAFKKPVFLPGTVAFADAVDAGGVLAVAVIMARGGFQSVPLEPLVRALATELGGRPVGSGESGPGEAWMSAEIELKYEGYLAREREAALRLAELASFQLPDDLPYGEFASISTEARQKLLALRPDSLSQASRIPGVSPSDLQNLVFEVVRRRRAAA